jgi:hypothetical protein
MSWSARGSVRAGLDKWWLLPFGVLAASALVALSIVVFRPVLVARLSAEVGLRAPSEPLVDCSGALASDYACYQQRYQNLTRDSGVEAAFVELKDEFAENEFVKTNCHQLVHVIGRTAFDLYGDIPGAYGRGDHFCEGGYYHGAVEAVAAKIGPEKIRDEADTLCAGPREERERSNDHFNCVHGIGHGLMGIQDNEVFDSLETCDALKDEWERESCYGGVFMENRNAVYNPSHPSKYLREDLPLYPCTEVQTRYKAECYKNQTEYALWTQGDDFAKVFDLCAEIEDDSRPACYWSLGRDASWKGNSSDAAETKSTCMLGRDYEARSNCVIGAVEDFILYENEAQARELCESLDADLRAACFRAGEEFSETFKA